MYSRNRNLYKIKTEVKHFFFCRIYGSRKICNIIGIILTSRAFCIERKKNSVTVWKILFIDLFLSCNGDQRDRDNRVIGHELSRAYSPVRINYGHLVATRCSMEDCIVCRAQRERTPCTR